MFRYFILLWFRWFFLYFSLCLLWILFTNYKYFLPFFSPYELLTPGAFTVDVEDHDLVKFQAALNTPILKSPRNNNKNNPSTNSNFNCKYNNTPNDEDSSNLPHASGNNKSKNVKPHDDKDNKPSFLIGHTKQIYCDFFFLNFVIVIFRWSFELS